jgi:hypothetical protein
LSFINFTRSTNPVGSQNYNNAIEPTVIAKTYEVGALETDFKSAIDSSEGSLNVARER